MIKKLVLTITTVLGVFTFRADSSYATTYYVRLDGGTALECAGTADAPYPGSGTGQPCAFIHPRYALGWGCTNMGNSCANGGLMQGGDTLYIDGDDPTNGGAQAQYEIGYDDTNNDATPGCSSSWPYDCTLGNLPAGKNTNQRTSIIGTGNHKPQLWGTQRVWQVLNADNNHIWLQNLEITDHDGCAYSSPDKNCNYSGPYSYGQWGEDGLYLGGDDVNVTDVYIHGLGRYGVNTDNIGSATLTRLNVIGNGYAGISTGIDATISGTLTFNQPIIEWNGCVESFPLKTNSPVDSPSNFSNCFGQNQNGYGDGLAFGNVGHGSAGNWVIYGPGSISFNTQDGLDTLHGNGNGTIEIDKMRFEGNAGNQVKMNALTSALTDSVVIGDCGWWLGAPQSSPGFRSGDICRALGDAILFNVTLNSQTFLYNNTILSNGNVALESEDLNGTGCNGSTAIYAKNNIVLGGYTWIDDTSFNGSGGNALTTYIYNDGNDGNGSGSCGAITWNEDYNIVYGTKNNNQNCYGTHNQCGTNPGFAGTIPMGTAGGAANTFYQGNSAETLLSLNSNSPAVASGVSGLNYWNNGNDYHNAARSNPPSKGGLELNSCAANAYGCFFNSDCCGGTNCTNFVCGGKGGSGGNNPAPNPPPPPPPSSSTTAQPVVTMTNPVNGSTFTSGTSVTLSATASENNGNIAQVAFYNNGTDLLGTAATPPYEFISINLPAGNNSLTAVATDTNGVSTTSSPIAVTVTAPVGQAVPVATTTNPTSGSSFTAGSNITITASASENNGTISQVAFYNGPNLLGTATSSPYSYTWNNVAEGNYSLTAIATDANAVTTTSSPITVTVTSLVTPGPNTNGPSISISSPANNASYIVPASILLTSNASSDATITRVDYYAGSIYLGESAISPYTVNWTSAQAGTYNITAKATDNNGAVFYSAAVNITVNNHTSPTVGLTTPVNNASYSAPANIILTADASVNGGSIIKVDFYSGILYLGTAYNSPYSINWNNIQSGNYAVTAKATDSYGWSTTSTPVNVAVTAANSPSDNGAGSTPSPTGTTPPPGPVTQTPPPVVTTPQVPAANPSTVNITSPVNNASYSVPASILLTANASANATAVSRVNYYAGSIYLGEATSSPFAVTWTSAHAGTYSLTAKATDSKGVPFYSAPVNITVHGHTPPTVRLTTPINNTSFNVPANIVLAADVTANGGSITKVDFYNGTLYLGTVYTSPYSINWNNVQMGNYSVTAKATDSYGWSTMSTAVNIAVTDSSSAPVEFIKPMTNSANKNTSITPEAVNKAIISAATTPPVMLDSSSTVLTSSASAPAEVPNSFDLTNDVLTSTNATTNSTVNESI